MGAMKWMQRTGWVLVALPLAASCAANSQYQAALQEREAENRALREERTALKNDMRDLEFQKESLEVALREANARLLEQPEPVAAQSFPELDDAGITYGERDGRMVITIPSQITFGSGKATLSEGGKDALTAVARALIDEYSGAEYWIEGHTDNDPIVKSKFATNRDLSLARAMAVLHYLVEETGVPDGQCVVAGWGEYRPLASNDTAANKALNRRVEIVVNGPGS
jgi:chemotaxis protein MotB